jgi:pimeloyl-ACP methyl ester carboxylesterase
LTVSVLDDLGVYYQDKGEGAPALLVHGFSFDSDLWQEQEPLAEEFRLVAYDARGSGRSAVPETGYSYDHLAAEAVSVLDALGIESAHLVGHSRGGGTILKVAFEHPERVRSLFFIDSVLRGFPWSDEFLDEIRRASRVCRERGVGPAVEEEWLHSSLFRWIRERRPEVLERVAVMVRRYSGAEWLDRAVYPKPDPPDLERLSEVRHPTFVLSGQQDVHDFVEIANMISWWVPGALQRSLLGVSHFPMLENPYETNLYLRGFWRSVERDRAGQL